jgi:PhnB protein
MWKPTDYPSVSPYLITANATRVMEFLEAVVDAERVRVFENDDGSIMHAEVRIDDSVVMIGEAGGDWPPIPSHVHVYVEDVDAAYASALENGGRALAAPTQNEGETDRRGGVMDPGGNTWWLATHVGESDA